MSQRRKAPCRFFSSVSGCRNGSACPFSHDEQSPSSRGQFSNASPSVPTRRLFASSAESTNVLNAPPGVCRYYWSGDCRRGFQCYYKHERPSTNMETEETTDTSFPLALSSHSRPSTNPTFTRPDKHTLSPGEAHNHIKSFLGNNYSFDGPMKMQGFVKILASVNDKNLAWVRRH